MDKKLSIIIPCLNEAEHIQHTLKPLQCLRQAGHQLILVDGHSTDETLKKAQGLVDQILQTNKGRAMQMNMGAQIASGDLLWFLHADSGISDAVIKAILGQLARSVVWGRFDVRLSGKDGLLRWVERSMNLRSCLTGICTGDQGIFIKRAVFHEIGGYAAIPLMEDIEISARLKRLARPVCVKTKLTTSSRKWEQQGIIRTILLMWRLRLAYFFGADPQDLVRRYYS